MGGFGGFGGGFSAVFGVGGGEDDEDGGGGDGVLGFSDVCGRWG